MEPCEKIYIIFHQSTKNGSTVIEMILYILLKRLYLQMARYPLKNQHFVQPFESFPSQQNSSQSLPISEYYDLPATYLPNRSMPHSASQYINCEEPGQSLSSSSRINLPDRYHKQPELSPGKHNLPDRHLEQSLSSSGRLNLPKVHPIQPSGSSAHYIKDNSYGQSASRSSKSLPPGIYSDQYLSSSDRQALPRRQYKSGLSLSSSDRQKLPGQGGDNSLSDILSITDGKILIQKYFFLDDYTRMHSNKVLYVGRTRLTASEYQNNNN